MKFQIKQTEYILDKALLFGDNFKKFRKLRGISQKEFAQMLFSETGKKLTLTSVSNYETGLHMPPPQILPVIAEILQVSIDALFGVEVAEPTVAEEPVEVDEVKEWKQELDALEKKFIYLKASQSKELKSEAVDCCEALFDIAKKQQDELIVLQTELSTIRELLSLFRDR